MKYIVVTRDGEAYHEFTDHKNKEFIRVKNCKDLAEVPNNSKFICLHPYPAGMTKILSVLRDKGCESIKGV